MVRFEKPTPEMVRYIADNMRKADAVEVWEMSDQTPIESLEQGVSLSNFCSVAVIDDLPVAVFGLVIVDIITGTGVPWLLGTNGAVKHRKVFLDSCSEGIDEMLNICPNLFNYVHAENKISVRWLKHMGFTIEEPTAMGKRGAMFHRFTMGDL